MTYYKDCDKCGGSGVAGYHEDRNEYEYCDACARRDEKGLSHLGLVPVAEGAVIIEDGESLREPILDLVANELLTAKAAVDEIVRLLYRASTVHVHWFIQTAVGERCEKCGLPRAAVGEDTE